MRDRDHEEHPAAPAVTIGFRYKATISDFTPFQMNHIIEMHGTHGEKLGKKALEHWKVDYGGTTRAKIVEIELI